MALPFGKLAILVGAGIFGSVLAKEGRLSDVSGFFSGALKIALKQLKQDNSTSPTLKPRNDALLDQVNSLRQELQFLAASNNRSITIVTASGTGKNKYGLVIVIVVVGYGYAWWKGWKLPNLMFATRRSLSDACSSISRQLENVYSSISVCMLETVVLFLVVPVILFYYLKQRGGDEKAERHLSSRIDRVDCSLDEFAELTAATKYEISELRGGVRTFGNDVVSVQKAVENLENKIFEIEGKQANTNEGITSLIRYTLAMENNRTKEQIEASASSSSRPALEFQEITPPSRTGSLPPTVPSLEPPPSPLRPTNTNESPKRPLENAASGLKDLDGVSIAAETINPPEFANGIGDLEGMSNGPSVSGLSGIKKPALTASFLSRTRSATLSFPFKRTNIHC